MQSSWRGINTCTAVNAIKVGHLHLFGQELACGFDAIANKFVLALIVHHLQDIFETRVRIKLWHLGRVDLFTHRWLPLSAKGTGRRVAENTKDDRSRTGSGSAHPDETRYA